MTQFSYIILGILSACYVAVLVGYAMRLKIAKAYIRDLTLDCLDLEANLDQVVADSQYQSYLELEAGMDEMREAYEVDRLTLVGENELLRTAMLSIRKDLITVLKGTDQDAIADICDNYADETTLPASP